MPQTPGDLGNSPISWGSWKSPKFLGESDRNFEKFQFSFPNRLNPKLDKFVRISQSKTANFFKNILFLLQTVHIFSPTSKDQFQGILERHKHKQSSQKLPEYLQCSQRCQLRCHNHPRRLNRIV